MPLFTNRLVHETSPYLLQHAHNPVDWYPWGEEAFAQATAESKPVLVSIGYAACHWCHVMERESFENEEVARFMNAHFINIKVDREERPDVDGVYMDAVQAISGSGGWPLNVFLTPEGKPFYGGTYYPPRRAFNRSSWMELLQAIAAAYAEKRDELETQALQLADHLQTANLPSIVPATILNRGVFDDVVQQVLKMADREWGGFGRAPKFPQTFTISFLLRYHYLTGNAEAREQALVSLDKMLQGGIYDQVGGGFSRYSTDPEWLVPHFEKMLYDNALLVMVLCEAYQLTQESRYHTVIEETLAFVERELQHPDGGFWSALDADSEGVEGKFYIWTYSEVQALLGTEAELLCAFYDITPGGNWEGNNILRVRQPLPAFAAQYGLEETDLAELLADGRSVLLAAREGRVRPGLDDKILLSWNALMNSAYCKAYEATGNEHYREVAYKNRQFLLQTFRTSDNRLYHTWKGGVAKVTGFLEDYSYLIAALLDGAAAEGAPELIHEAATLTERVITHFGESESPWFYFTPADQADLFLRKKELYDGATPSGNSLMARNLYALGILLDRPAWRERAEALAGAAADAALRYPTSFGGWLALLQEMQAGTQEIAVIGPDAMPLAKELQALYLPHKLLMKAITPSPYFPLLNQKKGDGKTLVFLCENYACQLPVESLEAFKTLTDRNNS